MMTVLGLPEPAALALLGVALLFFARSASRGRLVSSSAWNWKLGTVLSRRVTAVSKKSLVEMTTSVPASQIQ